MPLKELPIKIEGIVYRLKDGVREILALKRSEHDGGFWQPLTGTLEPDETLLECLVRELKEETGIDSIICISPEVYRFNWQKKDFILVELVYAIEVDSESDVKLSSEHQEFRWCNFEEALELFPFDDNKKALLAWQNI